MGIVQRKYPRLVYTASVDVLSVKGKEILCEGLIKNISVGGLAFETESTLPVGDDFRFLFFLPDKKNIKSIGKIVWEYKDKNENFYGVKFISLGFFSRLRLGKFINCELKKQPI